MLIIRDELKKKKKIVNILLTNIEVISRQQKRVCQDKALTMATVGVQWCSRWEKREICIFREMLLCSFLTLCIRLYKGENCITPHYN